MYPNKSREYELWPLQLMSAYSVLIDILTSHQNLKLQYQQIIVKLRIGWNINLKSLIICSRILNYLTKPKNPSSAEYAPQQLSSLLHMCLRFMLLLSFLRVNVACQRILSVSNSNQHYYYNNNTESNLNYLSASLPQQHLRKVISYAKNDVITLTRYLPNSNSHSNSSGYKVSHKHKRNCNRIYIFSSSGKNNVSKNRISGEDRVSLSNKTQSLIDRKVYKRSSNNCSNKNIGYSNSEISNKQREMVTNASNTDGATFRSDLDIHPALQLTPRSLSNNTYKDNRRLMKLIMHGLGLQRLPEMRKANISQQEYVVKYREYLQRAHERWKREMGENSSEWLDLKKKYLPLHLINIVPNATITRHLRQRRDLPTRAEVFSSSSRRNSRHKDRTSVILKFSLNVDAAQLQAGDIEEANIRLVLITSPSLAIKKRKRKKLNIKPQQRKRQNHVINIKVYQLLDKHRRLWLDGRKIDIDIDDTKWNETHSQWLEFDVTRAVEGWLQNKERNFGLEIKCDNCYRYGARIIDNFSDTERKTKETESVRIVNSPVVNEDDDPLNLTPVLNIVGHLGVNYSERSAPSPYHHHTMTGKNHITKGHSRKTNCYKDNQRCCRHTMEVVFKEIKGFEFIIQPKFFDAGYCRGRCPPRYNPAHHHAMLQSLIWLQNHSRVPRPCCAPSKLVELEVLHVDEKNSEKLKISTWTDMRVLECACS